MTLRDPIVIATIRGLLTAFGQAAFTGLTTYQVTNNAGDSFVVGAIAFLVALGFRGGVEGVWDQRKGPRPEEPSIVRRPNIAYDASPGPVSWPESSFPGPIPPIDLDEPYHFSGDVRHPGQNSVGCQWCLANPPPPR